MVHSTNFLLESSLVILVYAYTYIMETSFNPSFSWEIRFVIYWKYTKLCQHLVNGGTGEKQVCICWLIWCECHWATGQYVSNICMSHLDNYVMASFILTFYLSLKMVDAAKFDWHSAHSKEVWWLRLLVAGLSPHWPRFNLGPLHVGRVVDKMALGQIFLST